MIFGLLGIALLLAACAAPATPAAQENSTPEFSDFFSAMCPEGQFAVYNDATATGTPSCEAPRRCTADEDCSYLLIEQLPTRVGACENSVCVATCGSGISRPCR